MATIEHRIERLEDRLMPKETPGPYPPKTFSEEWLEEFRSMLEEHYRKYGWRHEPIRAQS
jgi:hypothetical protein